MFVSLIIEKLMVKGIHNTRIHRQHQLSDTMMLTRSRVKNGFGGNSRGRGGPGRGGDRGRSVRGRNIDTDFSATRNVHGNQVGILLMGNKGVGKTSLIQRYVNDTFSEEPEDPPPGSPESMEMKTVVRFRGEEVTVSLVDDTGDYVVNPHRLWNFYVRRRALIIVFDVSRRRSFSSLKAWVKRIMDNGVGDQIEYCLVIGNKRDKARECDGAEVRGILERNGMPYYQETSAKDGGNVRDAIDNLVIRALSLGIGTHGTSPHDFDPDDPINDGFMGAVEGVNGDAH